MNQSTSEFKGILRASRIDRGLQQQDLAAMFDVCAAYVSRMEKGYSIPGPDLLMKLCTLFGWNRTEMYLICQIAKEDNPTIKGLLVKLLAKPEIKERANG